MAKKESAKIEPRLLKGFRDYGPAEQLARQEIFSKIQSVFEQFGFLPLSTPALEYQDILTGKIGEDEKLMYSFKDNGDRDVAMRYDLTVPLARYVAQNQGQLSFPFKRYQIAPVWRADKPQKGRYREFMQCDVDVIGSDSVLADAEVIACLCKALEAVGVTNYRVRLNDRSAFAGLSVTSVRTIDKLDKIGVDGVLAELTAAGVEASEVEKVKSVIEGSGASEGAVSGNVNKILGLLSSFNLSGQVEIDPTIARGLDYYTGTVFEIVLADKPEFGSIVGGGRYDNLVDQFSSQSLPAVGGSIGIDRLLAAMEELGLLEVTQPIRALILNQSQSLQEQYLKLATDLRVSGVSVELYYSPDKLDKQFKYAESKNIPFAIIVGEEEAAKGLAQLKNLQTRQQQELAQNELAKALQG
jgi:histidyl-tRNA synthetase